VAAATFGVVIGLTALSLTANDAVAQTGSSGVSCNASGGSGGLSPGRHDITIAGRPALLYIGSGYQPSQPAMLTFFLHGDGANTQAILAPVKQELMDDNGWIYVAPRANGTIWYANGIGSQPSDNLGIEANAQLLEDVFEELFDDYNLCRNVLLGSSASGGSWFYDAYFLATRGADYPAYMNLGCGSSGINPSWDGFPFYSDLLTFNTDADILARTKLHYSIGTADFLFPAAQDAVPHLQSLGFDVTTDFRSGVGHCLYDVSATAVNWWRDLCESGFVPVPSLDAAGTIRPESCSTTTTNAGPTCDGRTVTVNLGAGHQPTQGSDVIQGTSGDDVIDGLGGNDVICGRGGNDELRGGPGNDSLFGGAGNDRIRGNAGNDTITGNVGNDFLYGGTGNDTIDGGSGNDTIGGFGGDDTITAGDGADVVFGGFGADNIAGGAGNDRLSGLVGNDTINGGDGADIVLGNAGQDTLFGGNGNDTVSGGNSLDTVNGGNGNDTVSGGRANDALIGGNGVDSCAGNRGTDTATGCETTFSVP